MNLETTKQVKGSSSFVAPYPYYEYQLDLMFFSDLEDQKFEQGMLCIDIFTNYAVVVPIKRKKEDDIAAGILEGMHNMGKQPEIFVIQTTRAHYISHQSNHSLRKIT